MLTTDLIECILGTIPSRTVGVLGDLFLDRYLDIDPGLNEPSVETGLTAYQVVKVRVPACGSVSITPLFHRPRAGSTRLNDECPTNAPPMTKDRIPE